MVHSMQRASILLELLAGCKPPHTMSECAGFVGKNGGHVILERRS